MPIEVLGAFTPNKLPNHSAMVYRVKEYEVIRDEESFVITYIKNENRLVKISGSDVPVWRQIVQSKDSEWDTSESIRRFAEAGLLGQPPQRGNPDSSTRTLCLHVAHACNMKCTYCYADGGSYGEEGASFLSYESAVSAIEWFDNIVEDNHYHVVFFGGEPLLQEDLIRKVVLYCKSRQGKNISFSLNTNGLLLTTDFVDFAHRNGLTISVSLDGNERTHNRHRFLKNDLPSYGMIRKRLDLIPDFLRIHLNSKVTVTKNTLDLVQTMNHMKELGFGEVDFSFVNCTDASLLEDEAACERWLPQLSELSQLALDSWLHNHPFVMNPFSKIYAGLIYGRLPSWTCTAGRELLSVDTSGNLYPCFRYMNDDDFLLGNVTRGLDGHHAQRFEEEKLRIKNGMCEKCWASMLCGGLCPLDQGIPVVRDGLRCRLTKAIIADCLNSLTECWLKTPELLQKKLLLEKTKHYFQQMMR